MARRKLILFVEKNIYEYLYTPVASELCYNKGQEFFSRLRYTYMTYTRA